MYATKPVFNLIDSKLTTGLTPGGRLHSPALNKPTGSGLPPFGAHLNQAIERGPTASRGTHAGSHDAGRAATTNASEARDAKTPSHREKRVDDARSADNERADGSSEDANVTRRRESQRAQHTKHRDEDQGEEADANDEIVEGDESQQPKAKKDEAAGDDATLAQQFALASATQGAAPKEADATDAHATNATADGDTTSTLVAVAAAATAATHTSTLAGGDDVQSDDDGVSPDATAASGLGTQLDAMTGGNVANQSARKGDPDADAANATADAATATAVQPTANKASGDHTHQQGGDGQSRDSQREATHTETRPHTPHATVAATDPSTENAAALAGGQQVQPEQQAAQRLDAAMGRMTSAIDAAQGAPLAQPGNDTAEAQQPTRAPVPPEQQFARDNLDKLVTSVRTQAATTAEGKAAGNQMHIRLDPPELGALEVAVKMIDGRMSASFTTSNDQATQLLSHSLNQLKSTLEAGGVQVDRIQVRQVSDSNSSASSNSQSGDGRSSTGDGRTAQYDGNAQQNNQQRRDAVERMWRRFAYGSDDLDLVA